MNQFRMVHLVPNPFTGGRVVLGALIADHGGHVASVVAPFLPSAQCLGGDKVELLARSIQESLHSISDFERVPTSLGPYVKFGDVLQVPNVKNPMRWVEAMLPKPAPQDRAAPGRRVYLKTKGYQFFQNYGVDQYVQKNFKPASEWSGQRTKLLHPLTHFVKGKDRLLLMEPIWLSRREYERDMQTVAERFGAYRHALSAGGVIDQVGFSVYVGPGGSAGQREDVLGALREFGNADRVVDTSSLAERAGFLADIRGLGMSARGQQVTVH